MLENMLLTTVMYETQALRAVNGAGKGKPWMVSEGKDVFIQDLRAAGN